MMQEIQIIQHTFLYPESYVYSHTCKQRSFTNEANITYFDL